MSRAEWSEEFGVQFNGFATSPLFASSTMERKIIKLEFEFGTV